MLSTFSHARLNCRLVESAFPTQLIPAETDQRDDCVEVDQLSFTQIWNLPAGILMSYSLE